MVQDWNPLCRPDDMALEVVGRASQKLEPVKRSTLDWDLQSCRSTSLGSDSSAPFAFSHATETDLGSCESVCSFPGTTNHAFFRLHRRSAAVNKIKPKVPNLYESKGVYHCLEQELWPNRKVTNYQLCFGKGAGRVGVCRSRAWMPPVGRPVQKTLPATKGTQQTISRPLDDSKSDSPPVSELGSLPLTDIAMTPSTSSRPSRPRSAMAPSRRTASAGAAAASASASASARPQSAASSSQLRLQSQDRRSIGSRPHSAPGPRSDRFSSSQVGTSTIVQPPSSRELELGMGKENQPTEVKAEPLKIIEKPKDEGRVAVRDRQRSRVKYVGCMAWIE